MNNAQRLLVIVALVVVGVVLAGLLLEWETGRLGQHDIFIVYEAPNPRYPAVRDEHGIYAAYGVPYVVAVFFGVVLPLCPFAAAAYLAFGSASKSRKWLVQGVARTNSLLSIGQPIKLRPSRKRPNSLSNQPPS
jgi:hypothetical protein